MLCKTTAPGGPFHLFCLKLAQHYSDCVARGCIYSSMLQCGKFDVVFTRFLPQHTCLHVCFGVGMSSW